MKINYALTSRILIAILFVVAGLQKLGINIFAPSTIVESLGNMGTSFSNVAGFISSLGVPMAMLATAIVIIIEIPVAILFAYGYRTCITGGILIGFTLLATILVHRHISDGTQLVMALKNIAIMGGLLSVITTCGCGQCPAALKG